MNNAPEVEITHPTILIRINKRYRPGMTSEELFEATRGIWRIGQRRTKAEFAFAIFQGVIHEVFQISNWYPAGTLSYKTRKTEGFKESGRWEFDGGIAPEHIRSKYIFGSIKNYIKKGNRNPIKYVNV